MTTIACRARVAPDCLHGRPTRDQFGPYFRRDDELDAPLSEDGTYNGVTIVCDACYMRLGGPPREVLEQAIAAARGEGVEVELGPGIVGYVGDIPSREQVVELVTRNVRELGCTCDVEVRVPENYGVRGEVANVQVLHDDSCPIVNPST